jgi:hypothetical protein
MDGETSSPLSRTIVPCALLGVLILGGFWWRNQSSRGVSGESAGPTIEKQPVNFANRTFDPSNPPPDMPPLSYGEYAQCDSRFLSNASVGGETRQTDAAHATVTVTRIKVTLQLDITTWLPAQVSQHVIEHEEGHRQISEYYYQTADKVARQIAAAYMGKQIDIAGADQAAESDKALREIAMEITDEYNKELNPEPTQLLYDSITNHGINDVVSKDAAEHAIRNSVIDAPQPAASSGN